LVFIPELADGDFERAVVDFGGDAGARDAFVQGGFDFLLVCFGRC
jgi:hypothetical protein